MGKIILYGIDISPPFRAVVFTLKSLELPFEHKQINLLENEQLSKEFRAKNSQHTVPTLEDDGHYICDSHAIMAYLVRKYGKDDSLYPKDLLKRAAVDQRLHYESGAIFHEALRSIIAPLFVKNETNVPQYKINTIIEVYASLERFLKDHNYIADDRVTIADFSIITSVTTALAFIDIDAVKFPKLTAWIKRMQQMRYYQDANEKGAQLLFGMIKEKNIKIVQ